MFIKTFTSRVSLEHEKHVLQLPMLMNQRVGHYASDVNTVIHMGVDQKMPSSSTETRDVKPVLKTFNSAFMLLLIQKEQQRNGLFNHT